MSDLPFSKAQVNKSASQTMVGGHGRLQDHRWGKGARVENTQGCVLLACG